MKKICTLITILALSCLSLQTKAQCGNASKELLGSISAMTAYNTYIVIGSFADMYSNDVITSKQLATYLDEQIPMIAVLIDNYNKALQNDPTSYTKDDKEFMNDCIATLRLLTSEAKALRKYADNRTDSNADEYQQYRKKAWSAVSDLLDLED